MTSAPLDAAGSDQATVFEMNAAGVAMNFAATYPERVRSLIAVNVRSSWGEFLKLSPGQHKRLAIRLRSPEWLSVENPRVAHDPVVQRWWDARLDLPTAQKNRHTTSRLPRTLTAALCSQPSVFRPW